MHFEKFLGDHVEQKGSLVNSRYLRFDFSHFSKVTEEQLNEIENLVIQDIERNIRLNEQREVPIGTAKQMGAMALFGEKYEDTVRVIQFDESVELCGGIHVPSTSDMGLLKSQANRLLTTGIREIGVCSGDMAKTYFRGSDNYVGKYFSSAQKTKKY